MATKRSKKGQQKGSKAPNPAEKPTNSADSVMDDPISMLVAHLRRSVDDNSAQQDDWAERYAVVKADLDREDDPRRQRDLEKALNVISSHRAFLQEKAAPLSRELRQLLGAAKKWAEGLSPEQQDDILASYILNTMSPSRRERLLEKLDEDREAKGGLL